MCNENSSNKKHKKLGNCLSQGSSIKEGIKTRGKN